jgi:hypothetical protein
VIHAFLLPVGSSPDRVKPKTKKLVFVASSLSAQHLGESVKTDWLGHTRGEHANHYITFAVDRNIAPFPVALCKDS